ncbi:MAG: DUF3786 domain-containing protein [Actinomycetia bacterium]|nr:DUF3786 domain-containing protein [Actinomycetes bacterium]
MSGPASERLGQKERTPLRYYSQRYADAVPAELTVRCGLPFADGAFQVQMLGQALRCPWPEFAVQPVQADCPPALLSAYARILLIRYLLVGVAAPLSDNYRIFRDFPQAAIYDATFQGRCVHRLAATFGSRPEAFAAAAAQLGGQRLDRGDVAVELPFLANVRLRLLLYPSDEEFPATAQFLFSDNAATAFSAEDLAVVGDIVIGALRDCLRKLPQ